MSQCCILNSLFGMFKRFLLFLHNGPTTSFRINGNFLYCCSYKEKKAILVSKCRASVIKMEEYHQITRIQNYSGTIQDIKLKFGNPNSQLQPNLQIAKLLFFKCNIHTLIASLFRTYDQTPCSTVQLTKKCVVLFKGNEVKTTACQTKRSTRSSSFSLHSKGRIREISKISA